MPTEKAFMAYVDLSEYQVSLLRKVCARNYCMCHITSSYCLIIRERAATAAGFQRHFKHVLKTLGIDVPQRQRWLQLVSEDEAKQIISDAPDGDQRIILLFAPRLTCHFSQHQLGAVCEVGGQDRFVNIARTPRKSRLELNSRNKFIVFFGLQARAGFLRRF